MAFNKKDKVKFFIVFIFFMSIYFLIFVRLFYLQVYKNDFYSSLAYRQYLVELKLEPPRGSIYDRSKIPLAINKDSISAFIIPASLQERDKILDFLKNNFSLVYEALLLKPNKKFLWIKRKLSQEEYEGLKSLNLKDLNFIVEPQRFYPFSVLSQVIGFTDIDNNGSHGIEYQFNGLLKGEVSIINAEKDARANKFYFKRCIKKEGRNGKPIWLTIDSKLQMLAADELLETINKFEAQAGAVIIMDPLNGEILSMVNYPFFDSNASSIDNLEIAKNIAISDCYEYGSVVKTFCALAALEEGVVEFDEVIDCEGKEKYFGSFKVENWKPVNMLPFYDVIKNSSNIGVAKVALRLGKKYYDYLLKLGFTKKTKIELPGEREGYITPPKDWSKSSPIVLSFGYEISATLIQLCKAFGIIANNGFEVNPTIVKNINLGNKIQERRLFSDKSIGLIKNILEKIGERYAIDGYKIMGKTGTARLLENGQYSTSKHIYTFCGIVEKDNYKRVIVTFVKEPKMPNLWASQVSAPLFRNIAKRMVINEAHSS